MHTHAGVPMAFKKICMAFEHAIHTHTIRTKHLAIHEISMSLSRCYGYGHVLVTIDNMGMGMVVDHTHTHTSMASRVMGMMYRVMGL